MNFPSKIQVQNSKIIRVLLVDDSLITLKIIERILSTAPDIRIVGAAKNGREALDMIPEIRPDVICTDLHMPVMDGLQLTKEVMARHPLPILVISVSVTKDKTHNVFKLLDAGAVDVFPKPASGFATHYDEVAAELISRIRVLSGVVSFLRRPKEQPALSPPKRMPSFKNVSAPVSVIIIGSSTGGPQILHKILSKLPAHFAVPIICVQHIGDDFLDGFIRWMASHCKLKVKIAQPGEFLSPGTIYFPQPQTHLKIGNTGRVVSSNEPPVGGHRPSITVTMKSLADSCGAGALGILLTGMGRDGADGLLAIARAGGMTIAQDEPSSIVFGMPKAAIELGAARYILSPDDILEILLQI